MRSVMQHTFSQVPRAEIPRSSFDRSHGYKTTFDAGVLIPIFVDEALPGDTFNLSLTAFARLATPIFPIMDNLFMDTFFFSVPIRLVWDNWQKFNGEQANPGDSTDYIVPTVNSDGATGFEAESIYDYMGLPVGAPGIKATAFPLRAYNLIFNEWFRDQNLIGSVTVPKGDGPDTATTYTLLRRGKRHDYFTSCLPWPQKGPGVSIPLGNTAPVRYEIGSGATSEVSGQLFSTSSFAGSGSIAPTLPNATSPSVPDGSLLIADLAEASAATINSLRQAFQIQKIYERDARGGTRYTELIKAHFGVTSPDARLQRPEFLGGGTSMVNISPIPQTSATGAYAESPQGNLAAMGTVNVRGHGFTASFTEHCVVIGLVCVRADLTYQQGLNRMWSRQTRFDYYWPALAHIGEQAVASREIFCDGTGNDNDVFGYQERYAEYRYKPSQITGQFRSSYPQSLDAWHVSQDFETRPVLDGTFINENPPVDRVIAVPGSPHFLFDGYFQMRCARPMPVYGVPGLIDHF